MLEKLRIYSEELNKICLSMNEDKEQIYHLIRMDEYEHEEHEENLKTLLEELIINHRGLINLKFSLDRDIHLLEKAETSKVIIYKKAEIGK